MPVCGSTSTNEYKTFANRCEACANEAILSLELGECKEVKLQESPFAKTGPCT
jgi:hypothetical protein